VTDFIPAQIAPHLLDLFTDFGILPVVPLFCTFVVLRWRNLGVSITTTFGSDSLPGVLGVPIPYVTCSLHLGVVTDQCLHLGILMPTLLMPHSTHIGSAVPLFWR